MTSKTTTFILSLFGEDTIADEKAAKTFLSLLNQIIEEGCTMAITLILI